MKIQTDRRSKRSQKLIHAFKKFEHRQFNLLYWRNKACKLNKSFSSTIAARRHFVSWQPEETSLHSAGAATLRYTAISCVCDGEQEEIKKMGAEVGSGKAKRRETEKPKQDGGGRGGGGGRHEGRQKEPSCWRWRRPQQDYKSSG